MKKLIAVVGTTASCKSDLGIELAKLFDGEIVSADSRQVYKGLDLGSGKVTKEEQLMAVHHMLDVVKPNEKFSVAEYQKLAYFAIDDILNRGKLPILVGGTGLYTRAVTDGFQMNDVKPDFELRKSLEVLTRTELIEKAVLLGANKDSINNLAPAHLVRRIEILMSGNIVHKQNKPKYEVLKLGLKFPREVLYQRIKKRIDIRLDMGMIQEIENLLKEGATPEFLDGLGLEYRWISRYVLGKISYNEFYDNLFKDTCHFSKRQETWFKKEKDIIWLDMSGDFVSEAKKLVTNFIK